MGSPRRKLDGSPPARGCILAGGAGRRFGGAKPTVTLAGRPLVSYPLAALDAAGLRPAIVAKPATSLPDLGVEVWREPPDPVHPLCGIVEALRRAGGGPILVCPCDLPFVTAELARWLAELPDPVAVLGSQPLLGRYSGTVAEPLANTLAAGRSMAAALAALDTRRLADEELRRFGDPAVLLANVNGPADLDRAERLLAAGGRSGAG